MTGPLRLLVYYSVLILVPTLTVPRITDISSVTVGVGWIVLLLPPVVVKDSRTKHGSYDGITSDWSMCHCSLFSEDHPSVVINYKV